MIWRMASHMMHPMIRAPRFDYSLDEARSRVAAYEQIMRARRTIREFASTPVPIDLLETAIAAAASAPSGANIQPWRFIVVGDPETKKRIRLAAEDEEREFYGRRASDEWLTALEPLGTNHVKPFLEEAPFLIVVMEVHKGPNSPRPYYVKESVGIAVGFLLSALHHAGLATLTHTPSPMKFLGEVLGRPQEERPYVLIPVGYPAEHAQVPDIKRKDLGEVLVRI